MNCYFSLIQVDNKCTQIFTEHRNNVAEASRHVRKSTNYIVLDYIHTKTFLQNPFFLPLFFRYDLSCENQGLVRVGCIQTSIELSHHGPSTFLCTTLGCYLFQDEDSSKCCHIVVFHASCGENQPEVKRQLITIYNGLQTKLEEMDSQFKVLPLQSKATISNSRKSAKPKQHYKNCNKQQIKVNSAANHMLPSPNQSLSSALNHP
jgi:hypothetical protein